MYEKNGICYAGSMIKGITVTKAEPLHGFMMLITFSTGEKRLLDVTKLKGSAFLPLRDEDVFAHPEVHHGFISWADGTIDIAPETAYEESYAYDDVAV